MADEPKPNHCQLIGYLEEALDSDEMSAIEENLRKYESWREALQSMRNETDLGEYTVAMVWRRRRISCISRDKLYSYLNNGLVPEEAAFIKFHLETVRCRQCKAQFQDLEDMHKERQISDESRQRRKRIFDSSVHALRSRK